MNELYDQATIITNNPVDYKEVIASQYEYYSYRVPKCRLYITDCNKYNSVPIRFNVCRSFTVNDPGHNLELVYMEFDFCNPLYFIYNDTTKKWELNYFNLPYNPLIPLCGKYTSIDIIIISSNILSDIFIECDVLYINDKKIANNKIFQISDEMYVGYYCNIIGMIRKEELYDTLKYNPELTF